ncbi:MAG: hypothetical protein ACK550_11250 [Synechococcaceae cyanobacterium]
MEAVAGGIRQEISALSNKLSSLDSSEMSHLLSAFSRSVSLLSRSQRLSLLHIRVSLSSDLILNLSTSGSMSSIGRQLRIPSQRRQSGKQVSHCVLVRDLEGTEAEEVGIAEIGCERDQAQEGATTNREPALPIQPQRPRR